MRVQVPLRPAGKCGPARIRRRRPRVMPLACWVLAGLLLVVLDSTARAQYPPANIPDLRERSGLVMRFAGRAGAAAARSPARQLLQHPVCRPGADQASRRHQGPGALRPGLEGGLHRERLPLLLRQPGHWQGDRDCLPWHRSLRFFQGETHPFRPVGMYYSMGSYVPIYDLDPIAPGPGPYPYPFYFNWWKGG